MFDSSLPPVDLTDNLWSWNERKPEPNPYADETRELLRLLWNDADGYHFASQPFITNDGRKSFKNYPATRDAAVNKVHAWDAQGIDAYFALAAFEQAGYTDPKDGRSSGAPRPTLSGRGRTGWTWIVGRIKPLLIQRRAGLKGTRHRETRCGRCLISARRRGSTSRRTSSTAVTVCMLTGPIPNWFQGQNGKPAPTD